MKTPEGWLAPAVGEIFEILGGGTPSTAMPQYWQGDIPWITSADIHGLRDVRPRKYVTREGIADSAANTAPPGSVIVVTRVALGKVALVERELSYSQDSQALVPKSGDVDSLFASYALSSATQVFKTDNRGTTIKGVTKKELRDLPLLLPPLPEQKKIAEILGSVDESIRATKAVIEQTKKVKKGLLQQLLTRGIGHTRFKQTEIGEIPESWEVVRTPNVCDTISVGIVVKPTQYYVTAGVPCFRSANIREGYVERKNWVYISPEANNLNSKSKLRTGDVLVVRTGYPGTSCVVPDDLDGSNCIDIIFARPSRERVLPGFLSWFINSPVGKRQVVQRQGGLAQTHFNVGALKEMLVPLPTIPEQARILERLNSVQTTQQGFDDALLGLEKARSGLMQDLLSGKIRVTG